MRSTLTRKSKAGTSGFGGGVDGAERFRSVKREKLNNDESENMRSTLKRKSDTITSGGGGGVDETEQLRSAKREKVNNTESTTQIPQSQQDTAQRRVLRSKYSELVNRINDNRDELSKVDSEKFNTILNEVENLHQMVQKPREQVADAEALLGMADTLMSSAKSQTNEGITPADFVDCLITEFGQSNIRLAADENSPISINWKSIGLAVSPIFAMSNGCNTMLGPMNTEVKQRKVSVRRKRDKPPTETAKPDQVDDSQKEEKTDTDQNMATMFGILRRKKCVKLENLILNRKSFAQTVENLFALSFLAKDGRVRISVKEDGSQLVAPTNAPSAESIRNGDAAYSHFVFRFDFKDWKLMMGVVPDGEELMPHRERSDKVADSRPEPPHRERLDKVADSRPEAPPANSQGSVQKTPIKTFSRNRGLVIREETVVKDSQSDDSDSNRALRCKRKLI